MIQCRRSKRNGRTRNCCRDSVMPALMALILPSSSPVGLGECPRSSTCNTPHGRGASGLVGPLRQIHPSNLLPGFENRDLCPCVSQSPDLSTLRNCVHLGEGERHLLLSCAR